MDVMEAIWNRRSIRRFRAEPVPRELVTAALQAAQQAPSPKNKQPWHFLVLGEKKHQELIDVMRIATERMNESSQFAAGLEGTVQAMSQAPVVILVLNAESERYDRNAEYPLPRTADLLSIGASIQNMLLAVLDQGLGALWICDILDAYEDVRRVIGREEELVAAVAIGYPDESPEVRPRKPLSELVAWDL